MSLELLQRGILITVIIPNAFDVDVWYIRRDLLLVRRYHVHRAFDSNVRHGPEGDRRAESGVT